MDNFDQLVNGIGIKHLNIIKHIHLYVVPGRIVFSLNSFKFQQLKETHCYCVIMAVAASAHRLLKIVSPDERSPVHAGELRALIRVDQHPLLRFAPPYRHVQRLQHRIGGLPALH